MDKLEIKLTLTADSNPELLAYLRGIPSARERAYILKRLAQRGLAGLGSGGLDRVALPAPSPVGQPPRHDLGDSPAHTFEAATPVAAPAEPAQDTPPGSGAVLAPGPAPAEPAAAGDKAPAQEALSEGFGSLDIGALNAAMARFE
ncbi:hypothetical protein BKK79_38045 (plasmid) [Cupriavidus sp. USMAA2-4]|uniref:hypothetical protein n=1 Tax=Cupriavidus sp. USMAA2-4 TaxID=876364 RepID=UPI0008A6ABC6|nr:hypothetical protein [Cupriavidus sp. USMAA2-4]AOY97727.1 hypothetical protein BKK79_38045 [Cupriavidus sp. USMAA2-4]